MPYPVAHVEHLKSLVCYHLHDQPDRLAHSLAVGRAAGRVEAILGVGEGWECSGVVHDIGYSAAARDTGLHQIDGARFLRSLGHDEALCSLVAWHSCAEHEITLAGHADLLTEFPRPSGPAALHLDLLTFCDMTTSPTGAPVGVEERLADIFDRYQEGSLVHTAITRAAPTLRATVAQVWSRLEAVQVR